MEHTKHIARAVLLLVVLLIVSGFAGHFARPQTFGTYGAYRFTSVAEHAALEPMHGARGECADCHKEQAETLGKGKHAAVSCEVCHAPLGTHVKNGERIGQMRTQRSYELCGKCHERLAARPKDFPQVVMYEHVAKSGLKLTDQICWECHENAHNPSGD